MIVLSLGLTTESSPTLWKYIVEYNQISNLDKTLSSSELVPEQKCPTTT